MLDIASYARRGPTDRMHLAQEEIQLLSRTVRRAPEVMVKGLTKGGRDIKAFGRHLSYLSREGELEIQTDDGRRLSGEGVEHLHTDEPHKSWSFAVGTVVLLAACQQSDLKLQHPDRGVGEFHGGTQLV